MDYDRLHKLEVLKGTMQYGESVTVPPSTGALSPGGGGLQLLSKDLVRWRGDKEDIYALRVYLGPWAPQPNMPSPAPPQAPYAGPTPWMPPVPLQLDNFQGIFYAKIQWGAGGVQHTAYVDWPARGMVLQVSGSYVQVDAAVGVPFGTNIDPNRLPILRASLGPEPGGGDSSRPATYSYPKQLGFLFPSSIAPTGRRWHFQVPPFARAFFPLVDIANLFPSPGFTEMRLAVQPSPQPIVVGPNAQTWVFVNTPPEGLDWPLEGFPIAGQTFTTLAPLAFAEGAVVTIEIDDTALLSPQDYARGIGCMFDLDL